MRSSLPTLLLFVAAPATQAAALEANFVAAGPREVAPSFVGGLVGNPSAPSDVTSGLSAQTVWLSSSRPALNEVDSYRRLVRGWDGAEGRSALAWSADAATAYIVSLPPDIPDPTPMIAPSGEVGLYWMDGDRYAEIGFEEIGTCFMFAEASGRETVHLDDTSPDDERLVAALRDILGIHEHVPLAA